MGDRRENEKKNRMMVRENRKWYLFYPEDKLKQKWDMLITYLLIFTCTSTPLFIAFHDSEPGQTTNWEWINIIVDSFFAIDIFVVYFSAFYDDDFQIVENCSDISRNYIFGWFFLDVMAITPFDALSSSGSTEGGGDASQLVRIAKLGRM
jgi:hypothetical protein